MTQKDLLEASDSLRQWFKRGGTDPKTGKKFKGWVNCKTGGPCGRKSKKSGGSYPACRPTKAACKKIKGKMYKKKSSKRVNWKSENAEEPKKGTGKKPKGSSRRLYTDENPKDTVSVKFSSVSDIRDTLNKSSFKSKSHARQSQIINLIHQRVRAAKGRVKDPVKKKRLSAAYEYISNKKEASKRKTKRLREEDGEKKGIHKPVKPGILKNRLGKLSCSKVRGAKGKLKNKGTHYAKALQRYLNYHC